MSSQRILVVDDSTLMLEVARNALEESGFKVATASTLAEFEAHDPTTFDLILMDVQMPELFGDDVAAGSGLVAGGLIYWIANTFFSGITLAGSDPFPVPWQAVLWGGGAGGVAALIGSVFPAWSACSVRPSQVFARVG